MKKRFTIITKAIFAAGVILFSYSCTNSENVDIEETNPGLQDRWITIAGSMQGTSPGDGNGGMLVYSVNLKDAKDASKEFSIFDNGFLIPSNRTARISSSNDGKYIYNIPYTGDNGGILTKLLVNGGNGFTPEGNSVSIAQYATTSPRWGKLSDGNTGVATNVANVINTSSSSGAYVNTRGDATLVSFNLQNPAINTVETYKVPLTQVEEALGHYIFRLDGAVLNRAGDKLILGVWMGKIDPATGRQQSGTYERLGSKSVVVDYPSLRNPTVITSTVGFGDTSGYRSMNSFLAEDGYIYQATQRDPKGGHILRINANNEYDNSYTFNLDNALGETGVSVDNWKYVGDGIAYFMYTSNQSQMSPVTRQSQSFLARLNLNTRTATKVNLPYDTDMYFFQYQNMLLVEDELVIPVAAVGKEGAIYTINRRTGAITKGATLKNLAGAQFIGAF